MKTPEAILKEWINNVNPAPQTAEEAWSGICCRKRDLMALIRLAQEEAKIDAASECWEHEKKAREEATKAERERCVDVARNEKIPNDGDVQSISYNDACSDIVNAIQRTGDEGEGE